METDTFSCNCETIAKEIDRLTDATDGDGLKDYVLQIELAVSSNALVQMERYSIISVLLLIHYHVGKTIAKEDKKALSP